MRLNAAPVKSSQSAWLGALRPGEEVTISPSRKRSDCSSAVSVFGSIVLHASMIAGLVLYGSELILIKQDAKPLEALIYKPAVSEMVKLQKSSSTEGNPTSPSRQTTQRPARKPAPVDPILSEESLSNQEKMEQTKSSVSEPPPREAIATSPAQATEKQQTLDDSPVITQPLVDARYSQSNLKPQYPAMARRLGHQGTVTLEVTVSPDGQARQVKVAESSGYQSLDKAAIQAISRWRFIPATINGEAVEQSLLTRWTYKLN